MRRSNVLAGALCAVVVTVAGVTIARGAPKQPAYTTPPGFADRIAAQTAITGTPELKKIPAGAKVLFFGDSYVYGTGADQPTDGFAYLTAKAFGWQATIDGAGGTGFTTGHGPDGTYSQRLTAALAGRQYDLIVVEDGINDQDTESGLQNAADAFLTQLQKAQPHAQIVVMGPADVKAQNSPKLAQVDYDLMGIAALHHVTAVSPYEEHWITKQNVAAMIGPDQTHPTTLGHAYFAQRLAADLKDSGA